VYVHLGSDIIMTIQMFSRLFMMDDHYLSWGNQCVSSGGLAQSTDVYRKVPSGRCITGNGKVRSVEQRLRLYFPPHTTICGSRRCFAFSKHTARGRRRLCIPGVVLGGGLRGRFR